mgnify:CR=1 FL=1
MSETENDVSYRQFLAKMLDPSYLPTISMSELYENVYEKKPPIIDGLLYPGTYLFVGAPKVGKSFFMLQLAYHISTGTPLWNFPVWKGSVNLFKRAFKMSENTTYDDVLHVLTERGFFQKAPQKSQGHKKI